VIGQDPARAATDVARQLWRRLPPGTTVDLRRGTTAAVAQLRAAFGAPVVLMGFTPPDARIHAPGQRMHRPVLWRAVTAAARFHHHLARQ
jgi:hypothetical protein